MSVRSLAIGCQVPVGTSRYHPSLGYHLSSPVQSTIPTDLDPRRQICPQWGVMKLLHTADWHLGDRLGRIDRTDDLRRSVERVAGYCESERVDVLLVAGDLFSELARPDGLRDAV